MLWPTNRFKASQVLKKSEIQSPELERSPVVAGGPENNLISAGVKKGMIRLGWWMATNYTNS